MEDWELDPRICVGPGGKNVNICVAEGCFREACCELGWEPPANKERNMGIEQLRKKLEDAVRDTFTVGDVIKWTSAGRYTYAAIKTDVGWFATARPGNPYVPQQMNFEQLIEVLREPGVSLVQVATDWEDV